MKAAWRGLRILVAILLAAVSSAGVVVAWLWQTRAQPDDMPLPVAAPSEDTAGRVTVTWLGITTLLFDDGETQILTDATFSRFGLATLALMPLHSDLAKINFVLDEYRMQRVAAIIPLHSHFDHAIDAGYVANRTNAMVLGSESTANIARGSDVPVDQYQTLDFGESRYFGDFTVTLLESRHVPLRDDGSYWFPGIIEAPLQQPARVYEWQAGATYSLLISHPSGTTLVQGSAGFVDGQLAGQHADVVMLSIAGLAGRGREYAQEYWAETVGRTGATRVYPIHFDDYTYPFGEVALFPDILDDVVTASDWLRDIAGSGETPVTITRPRFGEPIVLY